MEISHVLDDGITLWHPTTGIEKASEELSVYDRSHPGSTNVKRTFGVQATRKSRSQSRTGLQELLEQDENTTPRPYTTTELDKEYLSSASRNLFGSSRQTEVKIDVDEEDEYDEETSFLGDFLPSRETVNTIGLVAGTAARGITKGVKLLSDLNQAGTEEATLQTDKVTVRGLFTEGPPTGYPGAFETPVIQQTLQQQPVETQDTRGDRRAPPSEQEIDDLGQDNLRTMPTTFVREIKVKELRPFDGTPADLDSFDNAVKICLLSQNLPLYYGGYVTGDPDDEYTYVAPTTANSKSNYVIGKRMCMAVITRFTDTAQKWWEEYDSLVTNPQPNCWKKHASMPRPIEDGHGAVVEVSLFELLKEKFCGDMDARVAEIELGKFRWEPFKKDNKMNLVSFRTNIDRLLKRAQKVSVFDRIRHIRNALPADIKAKTEICDTEAELWKKIEKIHVTMEVDIIDNPKESGTNNRACGYCSKVGHTEDVCRKKKSDESNNKTTTDKVTVRVDTKRNDAVCNRCGFYGHDNANCYSKRHKSGSPLAPTETKPNSIPQTNNRPPPHVQQQQPQQQGVAQQQPTQGGTPQGQGGVERTRICYRCYQEGHLARNCKVAANSTTTVIKDSNAKDKLANYSLPTAGIPKPEPVYYAPACAIVHSEIDERAEIVVDKDVVPLPLYNILAKEYVENDVFSVPIVTPDKIPEANGCLWSLADTAKGQQLLTVWDTGAVVCVVPMSTIVQTHTKWEKGADISFLMADGLEATPVGMASKFVFQVQGKYFAVRVYIVETANFQLLVGTEFMVAVGAALFPRWNTIILTIPARVQLTAYCRRITVSQGAPPLKEESETEVDEDELEDMSRAAPGGLKGTVRSLNLMTPEKKATTLLSMATQGRGIKMGMRDLIHELDGEGEREVQIPMEQIKLARTTGLPILTVDFVLSVFKFGPGVDEDTKRLVCEDVIEFADVFSWNEFDLGRISDVRHAMNRHDHTPAVQASRKHLYNPSNASIIATKSYPLIELGVYQKALPMCKDRAQLTICRRTKDPVQRNDPAFCRIAHDYRALNDRVHLDPMPVDTIVEMLAWMSQKPTGSFYKVDADRGFNQIEMEPGYATDSTAFEMFQDLWVSTRMLFGLKNGPATFKRNALIMLEALKGRVKAYFDDIFGKANKGDYNALRSIWRDNLLQLRRHGWKCKPSKSCWGFEEMESVGFIWSENGIAMAPRTIDAFAAMRMPSTLTELRSFLGLANQFRDRVQGYALQVVHLTNLTKKLNLEKGKVSLTPEAVIEFGNVKQMLASPAVLQQFQYDRVTLVYTDASNGTQDGILLGGLGVVITQIDPDTGGEYLCACASSGLSSAQQNYHIVRLELLAFVFACGKFHEWLSGVSFKWRTDCRAHQYLEESKASTNPTIARYALALGEYRYTIEWIPGVKMIADPFSRMVLVPANRDAITLSQIVFGDEMGLKISAEKAGYVTSSPLMFFSAVQHVYVERSMEVLDMEDGTHNVPVFKMSNVPMMSVEKEKPLVALMVTSVEVNVDKQPSEDATPGGEFVKYEAPALTMVEERKLEAIRHVKSFLTNGSLPPDAGLSRVVRHLASKMKLEGGKVYRVGKNGNSLEVLHEVKRMREVFLMLHEGMGHRSVPSMYKMFELRYWVPAAGKLLHRHMLECKVCQVFSKPNPLSTPGFRMSPTDVFAHWSIDYAGPFPADTRTGHRYALLAVEWVTRWVEGVTSVAADAENSADFVYSNIVTRFGCPLSIQSDRGSHFVNPIIKRLCEQLKIKHKLSTPYYPQSNGRVERVVGTVKVMLRRAVWDAMQQEVNLPSEEDNILVVNGTVDEDVLNVVRSAEMAGDVVEEDPGTTEKSIYWAPLLQSVLWAYRATPHSATNCSPALLALGKELAMPFDMGQEASLSPLTEEDHKVLVARRLAFIYDGIPGLREIKEVRKDNVEKDGDFVLGQRVWKRESKYDQKGFAPVFAPRWTGPFIIHSVWKKNVYMLRTDPSVTGKRTGFLKNPINGNRLRAYVEGEIV